VRYAIVISQRAYLEGIGPQQLLVYLSPMTIIAAATLSLVT
jgi:hypothetical protein